MTLTPEDPTLPFDDYFTSPAHTTKNSRALYYMDTSGMTGYHFDLAGFTTDHLSNLLSAYAAHDAVREELDREIQDLRRINDGLQRQGEQAENRNAQLCAEIDELQAQLREQQLTSPPEDTAADPLAPPVPPPPAADFKAMAEELDVLWRRLAAQALANLRDQL